MNVNRLVGASRELQNVVSLAAQVAPYFLLMTFRINGRPSIFKATASKAFNGADVEIIESLGEGNGFAVTTVDGKRVLRGDDNQDVVKSIQTVSPGDKSYTALGGEEFEPT